MAVTSAQFKVPDVPENPDGWGPPENLPLQNPLGNFPFAPTSLSEKLGRAADWTRAVTIRNSAGLRGSEYSVFDFVFDRADEETFQLVDGRPITRPKFGPRWKYQNRPQLPQRKDEELESRKREAEKEKQRRDRFYYQRNMQRR